MKRLLVILPFLLLLAGCVREREALSSPEGTDGLGKVTLSFEVAAGERDGSATKSVLGEDTPLDNLYIAVFGGSGYLKEYVKAFDLEQVADTTYIDRQGYSRTVPRY